MGLGRERVRVTGKQIPVLNSTSRVFSSEAGAGADKPKACLPKTTWMRASHQRPSLKGHQRSRTQDGVRNGCGNLDEV